MLQPIKLNTISIQVQKRMQFVNEGMNVPMEKQEIMLAALISVDKYRKQEKKEDFKRLNKWEQKYIQEKNREMNALQKDNQKKWKDSHKSYIKTFNKHYYEQNKEAIKKQKRERYQAKKLEKQHEEDEF